MLEVLNSGGATKTFRIEEVPSDEVSIADDETLVPVAHFHKVHVDEACSNCSLSFKFSHQSFSFTNFQEAIVPITMEMKCLNSQVLCQFVICQLNTTVNELSSSNTLNMYKLVRKIKLEWAAVLC